MKSKKKMLKQKITLSKINSDEIESLHKILRRSLSKITKLEKWKIEHENLTLDRFENELIELLNKPDGKFRREIKDLIYLQVWYKENNNSGSVIMQTKIGEAEADSFHRLPADRQALIDNNNPLSRFFNTFQQGKVK